MKDYKKVRCLDENGEYFTSVNTISTVIEKDEEKSIPYDRVTIDFDRGYKKSGVTKKSIKLYEK
jgi:hypothetical protein